jgi:hypothetical protein
MLPKTRSELELSTLIMTDTVRHVQFKLGVISFVYIKLWQQSRDFYIVLDNLILYNVLS